MRDFQAIGSNQAASCAGGRRRQRGPGAAAVLATAALVSFLGATGAKGQVPEPDPLPWEVGEWTAPVFWGPPPAGAEVGHAIVIPVGPDRGKVLLVHWNGSPTDRVWIWDPSAPQARLEISFAALANDIFCSGHTTLSNGDVFFAGGFGGPAAVASYIYNSIARTFGQQDDMAVDRWYPSVLLLSDSAFTPLFGGHPLVGGADGPVLPWERFDPSAAPAGWTTYNPTGAVSVDGYPRMFQLSTGHVFVANDVIRCEASNNCPGQAPASMRVTLSTSTMDVYNGPSPLTPTSDRSSYGTAVLIHDRGAADRVITIGGWCHGASGPCPNPAPTTAGFDDALGTADELVGWGTASAAWVSKARMNHPRVFLNAVLLPDGTVFVVGGARHAYNYGYPNPCFPPLCPPQYDDTVVKVPEIFDPGVLPPGGPVPAGSWKTMAEHTVERIYHSVAILLDDGRVAVIGGEQYPHGGSPFMLPEDVGHSVEIFSPPYLFQGARPAITASPGTVNYGQPFQVTVEVPAGQQIGRVALIRPNNVTHHFDFDQRYVQVDFTSSGGPSTVTLQATAPTAALAPPGYYRLWVVTTAGVPSTAAWVHLQ